MYGINLIPDQGSMSEATVSVENLSLADATPGTEEKAGTGNSDTDLEIEGDFISSPNCSLPSSNQIFLSLATQQPGEIVGSEIMTCPRSPRSCPLKKHWVLS